MEQLYIWIQAEREDKETLEAMGIRLGGYDDVEEVFEPCLVSREALSELDDHWGDFIWGVSMIEDPEFDINGLPWDEGYSGAIMPRIH